MNSFGATLKREREARGIPLEEVSEQLKIGIRLLRALEDEQLAQLPGGIFNKSFLRQYARYLGLDEDQIVGEYLKAVGAAPEPAPGPGPMKETASFSGLDESPGPGYPTLILTAILVGLAVGGVLYRVHQYTERRAARHAMAKSESPSQSNPPAASGAPDANTPADAAPITAPPPALGSVPAGQTESSAATNGAAPMPAMAQAKTGGANESQRPAAPVAPGAGPSVPKTDSALAAANPSARTNEEPPAAADATALQLQIGAKKDCWISIDADGRLQWQGTLPADRTRSVQARDSFRLRIGDAGAVNLTLNGKPLPSLGRSGEVKTVTISAKGLVPAEQ